MPPTRQTSEPTKVITPSFTAALYEIVRQAAHPTVYDAVLESRSLEHDAEAATAYGGAAERDGFVPGRLGAIRAAREVGRELGAAARAVTSESGAGVLAALK